MTTFLDPHVGRLTVPEFDRVTYLPGLPVGKASGSIGWFSWEHRRNGTIIERGWSAGLMTFGGLTQTWEDDEDIQRLYDTPEDWIASFGSRLRAARDPRYATGYRRMMLNRVEHGFGKDVREVVERGIHAMAGAAFGRTTAGPHIIGKLVWNTTAPAQSAGIPAKIALSNLSTQSSTQAYTDLSIATSSGGVTTNEWTTNNLSRTAGLAVTDSYGSSADAQLTETFNNTFTDGTGASTVYGGAVFDNQTAASSNMYMESDFTSSTLQINDTLAVTATLKC